MKKLIFILLILLSGVSCTQAHETTQTIEPLFGFSDDVSVDFMGFSFLVASHYEYFHTWPSKMDDLLKLKNKLPETVEAIEIIKTKFKNLKFKTINGESNIHLTYIQKDGTDISGTIIFPPMEDTDQMIQHMRAEGDLVALGNR